MTSDIVVSVDLDDTLITDNQLERTVALTQLDILAAEHGSDYDRMGAEDAIDDFLTSARESDRDYDAFIAKFFARFSNAGTSVDTASAFRSAVLAEATNHVRALSGARETLAGLDRLKIPYAMLTNGWTPLQEKKARLIGFRGPVFVSERIGARKPAPAAFATLSDYFGVPCHRIWHVGDNARADCAGAKLAGMTTVWFDRREHPYPSDVVPPDYVVRSHAELLALLSAAACGDSRPIIRGSAFEA